MYSGKQIIQIIILFFFIHACLGAQNTTELAFTGGAPLESYQPSIIIPILDEAFRINGIKFSSEYNPSLRSLVLSNSGEYDGELHRVYDFHIVSSGKYPNLRRIDTPLMSVWRSFFTTIPEITVETAEDLLPYRVAYYRGRQNIQKLLKGLIPDDQIQEVNTDRQAFEMLAAGRVDIVISESTEGLALIAENNSFSEIYELKKFDETKIYSYIHKKHESLLPIINETILKMKEDGTYQRLFEEAERLFYRKKKLN